MRRLIGLSICLALLAGCAPAPIVDERAATESARSLTLPAARPADPAALRAAFAEVSIGALAAPPESALRAELLRRQATTAAQLDALADALPAPQTCGAHCGAAPTAAPTATLAPDATLTPAPQLRPPAARPAPPTNTALPAAPQFVVAGRRSFDATEPNGQYASCIDIQVVGRNGPVGGAVIGINNGDHSYQNQTDAAGYTGRCGLGASTWSVVLFWAPPNHPISGATTTVWLNGAAEQRAVVVFREQ